MSACAACGTDLAESACFQNDAVPLLLHEGMDLAREWGSRVLVAQCEADLGTWLVQQGRPEEAAPYLTSARATYESLGAARWLQDLDRATASVPAQG